MENYCRKVEKFQLSLLGLLGGIESRVYIFQEQMYRIRVGFPVGKHAWQGSNQFILPRLIYHPQ